MFETEENNCEKEYPVVRRWGIAKREKDFMSNKISISIFLGNKMLTISIVPKKLRWYRIRVYKYSGKDLDYAIGYGQINIKLFVGIITDKD